MKQLFRKKFTWLFTLAIVALVVVPMTMFGAELATAELSAPINDVTVTQGSTATFTISVDASGPVKCSITSSSPATAKVHTVYSIDAAGNLTSATPSSSLNFFAGTPIGASGNCDVTWTGAPTKYSVSASVSAAATTPIADYTITLSTAAGTTSVTSPANPGLNDNTATTIAIHVVAPPNTAPTSPGAPTLLSGSNPNNTGQFTLSWTASTDAEGNPITYLLEHKDANDASYSTVASGLTANSYTFTSGSPEAEGTWAYRVQASDGSLTSAFSGDSTPIVVDKTAPNAPTAAATAGVNPYTSGTWTNQNVSVSFTANGDSDLADGSAGSGVASCTASSTLTAETASTVVSGTCTDAAGNISAPASVTVKIDTTAPNAPTANVSPIPNGAGWNNSTPVTVSFSDNGDPGAVQSGVGSCSGSTNLTSETAGTPVSGTCTDVAGNTSAPASVTVKIDTTAPVVAVTGVADGATYTLGSVPAAGCSTSDALSGVATNATLSSSGGPVGEIIATCSGATDVAGNPGSASATYNVIYKWTGFFQPVDNLPALNVAKAGSAIPVKFSLGGNQGMAIFATGFPASKVVTCDAAAIQDAVEATVTAGSSSLSYDALADQYNYVWKTDKAWAGTCRQLVVKLADGTFHQANFKLTK